VTTLPPAMAPIETPVIEKKSKEATRLSQPWNVVVHDDPVNLIQYVVKVLRKVFGYGSEKAEALTMAVHKSGRAVVWTGDREKAELYVQQLHHYQLHASLEKAE